MKIFSRLIGITLAAASGLSFIYYYSKPSLPEMDLLREASTYVQQYDGQNPREALDYARRTLNIIIEKNTGIRKISDLEKQLAHINTEIRDTANRLDYQPILNSVGELNSVGKKIEEIADNYTRKSSDFVQGIVYGTLSMIFLGISSITSKYTKLNRR